MNKLLAFLGGVAVAYFVMQELDKRKAAEKPSTPPVDPNQAACEAQLLDKLKLIRLAGDSLETFKNQFMVECLGGNTDYGGQGSVESNPSAVNGMPCPLGTAIGVWNNGVCTRRNLAPINLSVENQLGLEQNNIAV